MKFPSRRLVATAPLALLLPACAKAEADRARKADAAEAAARAVGRVAISTEFRPKEAAAPGAYEIGSAARRTQLYIPKRPAPAAGYPLALVLHGATQNAQFVPTTFSAAAEKFGVVLVAPNSAGVTWDLSHGPRGADAVTIQQALDGAVERAPIDKGRIACAGFSDGASYALSLGLTEGTLFSDILAFSPGYMVPGAPQGRPRVFISHGRSDNILPFSGGRRIARQLKAKGYDVEFYAFNGSHWPVPGAIEAAFKRFLTPRLTA